jgi:hypothetical protein
VKEVVNCSFKFRQSVHEQIVLLMLQHLKKDKFSIASLLSSGPPNEYRWLSWMTMTIDKYEFKLICEEEYFKLISCHINKEIDVQIRKDLGRSAPQVQFFQREDSKSLLYNVLKAVAVSDPELSYCQGMNILIAYLLLVSDGNELETFNLIKFIFSVNCNIKLREFYLNGFPRLNMYLFLLKEIVKEKLPDIHKKIDDLKIPDELWLFKWLQSLFAITLPFAIVVRLWDCLFAFGIEFILNYSVVFIFYNQEKILKANDVGDFLDSFKYNFKDDKEMILFRENIIKDSKKFKISETLILKLKSKFEKTELEKFNFQKNEKHNVSLLSSTDNTDLKSNNHHFEGKNELAKIEKNLKYISEVSESGKDVSDINQINIEIPNIVEERKGK